jgi:hypothetical protein
VSVSKVNQSVQISSRFLPARNQKLFGNFPLAASFTMSFFPPQDATGFQSQSMAAQQAALQRLQAQAFQHSWYFVRSFPLLTQFIQNHHGWRRRYLALISGLTVLGLVIGSAMGMFLSGMRYDAPGAFALPGGGGTAAFNNLKWHRQLYLGLKDMGTQGWRTGKVTPLKSLVDVLEFREDWSHVLCHRVRS